MKHKHSELIKAWADGAEIQYYDPGLFTWVDMCGRELNWHPEAQYRIKPEKKIVKYRLSLSNCNGNYSVYACTPDYYEIMAYKQSFIKWLGDEQVLEIDE